MTRFHRNEYLSMVLFMAVSAGLASATSPNSKLLFLVPPDAEVIAGIDTPPSPDQPDNFVLMTHDNTVDLEDFYALTGADSTRIIHQFVFVATNDNDGQLSEHSLLVSGHFDQPHIFKSAVDGGAAASSYRSIPVLEIQPFTREQGTFNDVRWLAVLDSNVLIFGSIASTRVELDRYLARSQPDASLLRRLARLSNKNQTWCLLAASSQTPSSPGWEKEIHDVLVTLNPELAELAQVGDEFEFGVHYGRHVEFEYEAIMPSTQDNYTGTAPLPQSPVEQAKSALLLPGLSKAVDANTIHGVIVVPVSRYKKWIAQIRRTRLPLSVGN